MVQELRSIQLKFQAWQAKQQVNQKDIIVGGVDPDKEVEEEKRDGYEDHLHTNVEVLLNTVIMKILVTLSQDVQEMLSIIFYSQIDKKIERKVRKKNGHFTIKEKASRNRWRNNK